MPAAASVGRLEIFPLWQGQAQLPAPSDLIFNNFILLLHPKQSSRGNYSLRGRSSSGESQGSSVGLPGLAAGQGLPQPWPLHGVSSAMNPLPG